MSSITSPVLLNSTGVEANNILKGIESALKAQGTLIDDATTSSSTTWSSEKIVAALTTTKNVSGENQVTFKAIAATPLVVKTTITQAPVTVVLQMSSSNGNSRSWSYLVPANGIYDWSSGTLVMEDGQQTQLVSRFMPAYDGETTLTASNVAALDVSYRAIITGGEQTQWDVISGGNAH